MGRQYKCYNFARSEFKTVSSTITAPHWNETMFYRMASTKTTVVFLLSSVAVSVLALPARNSTSGSSSSTSYCYGKDPKPYLRFGSMEAYEPKHGDLSKIQSPKGKATRRNAEKYLKLFVLFSFRLWATAILDVKQTWNEIFEWKGNWTV